MAVTHERLIGDILIDHGVITPLELDEALQRQRLTGEMLGRVLVQMGLCDEQAVVEALGVQAGMERVDVNRMQVSHEVLGRVSSDIARFYNIVPIRFDDGVLTVAMADPLNLGIIDDLTQILGCKVRGAVSNEGAIAAFIKNNYSYESESVHETLQNLVERVGDAELTAEELGQQQIVGDVDNLVQLAQEPEIIKIVNLVLLEAAETGVGYSFRDV